MKPLSILIIAILLPLAALAQSATPALGVALADFLYLKRPVIVFADSPADPAFIRQMALLSQDPAALDARDVIVITDTDPTTPSAIRLKLRPRGFALVLIDKDGTTAIRKPLPWDVREITRTIDNLPSAIEDAQARNP
jgi:hypothetical protein